MEWEDLGLGCQRVIARYGYRETPDVPRAVALCRERGLAMDVDAVTYVLGRETILARGKRGMVPWRERLFGWMARNATRPLTHFRIPAARVLEVGAQIET